MVNPEKTDYLFFVAVGDGSHHFTRTYKEHLEFQKQNEKNRLEEKNKLEWVTINDELLNNSKFAGNYNIPHIIRQIKVYLKNGTGIDKY